MARRWMLLVGIMAVGGLVTMSLVSCESGKPLSQMGPAKYAGSDKCANVIAA